MSTLVYNHPTKNAAFNILHEMYPPCIIAFAEFYAANKWGFFSIYLTAVSCCQCLVLRERGKRIRFSRLDIRTSLLHVKDTYQSPIKPNSEECIIFSCALYGSKDENKYPCFLRNKIVFPVGASL